MNLISERSANDPPGLREGSERIIGDCQRFCTIDLSCERRKEKMLCLIPDLRDK